MVGGFNLEALTRWPRTSQAGSSVELPLERKASAKINLADNSLVQKVNLEDLDDWIIGAR